MSIAAENRLHVTERIDFVVGASYDWRHLEKAQDLRGPIRAQYVNYPLADGNATNVQGAIIFNYRDTGYVQFNVSSRARFPTLFERFSTRFGASISNPNLEAGTCDQLRSRPGRHVLRRPAARRLRGVLQRRQRRARERADRLLRHDLTGHAEELHGRRTASPACRSFPRRQQTQNVGDAKYYGFEFAIDGQVVETVNVGVRYTYINRNIDAQNPDNPPLPGGGTFHLTGVPYSQLFAYVTWDVTPRLSVTPNLQLASDRWTNTTNGSSYFKTGSFTLLNLEAQFAVTERIAFQVGARNLLDQNYQLVGGFPSEGRSFFVNLRIQS